jgi:hypothetical protein
MPVARYFLFVGGVLLALLFLADAFAPQQPAVASNGAPSVDKYAVRIKSDQKLPERVVYDTSLPSMAPAKATVVAAAAPPAPAPQTSAQARVRDTFAQFVPTEAEKLDKQPDKQLVKQAEKQPEPLAPKKRKIARAHPSPQPQQTMRFAQQQQPRFGFFGGPTWNNTW